MAQRKPKNEFEEQKELQQKARQKAWNAAKEKMIRERTGITRHSHKVIVQGIPVARMLETPKMLRERWGVKRNGTRICMELWRFIFQADDGRVFTVKHFSIHETKHGYMLSLSRFYDLKPA